MKGIQFVEYITKVCLGKPYIRFVYGSQGRYPITDFITCQGYKLNCLLFLGILCFGVTDLSIDIYRICILMKRVDDLL